MSNNNIAILVVFHEVSPYRALKEPYKEICNRSNLESGPEGFEYYVDRLRGFESPVETWAEVASLIEGGNMFPEAQYIGLQHYRRIFALNVDSGDSSIITANYLDRYEIASQQIIEIQSHLNRVVIPIPEMKSTNLYDDFTIHHEDLVDGLNAACEIFDSETSFRFMPETAREFLKNTNLFYPYNMFLGPKEFYEEWKQLLLKIMSRLDEMRFQFPTSGPQNRWGGYIVERIFSIFVHQIVQEGKWEVTQKPIYFFMNPYDIANERLEAIESSNIWKITSPLRKFVDLIKALKITKTDNSSLSIKSLEFNARLYKAAKRAKKARSSQEVLSFSLRKSGRNGLALEFGVYKGDTLNVIARLYPGRTFGFDSFEGLPEDWREGFPKGTFGLTEIPEVKDATLVHGLFQDTLSNFLLAHDENIDFLHLDADLYSSTKFVLSTLNSRIKKDCIILFDEFMNYPGFEKHEYLAFEEWCQEYQRSCKPIVYSVNKEQMGFLVMK